MKENIDSTNLRFPKPLELKTGHFEGR